MFKEKTLFLKKKGTGTELDYLRETARLNRVWMENWTRNEAHYGTNPTFRNGSDELDGANIKWIGSRRDTSGGYSIVLLDTDPSFDKLYVYFLEGRRYMEFTKNSSFSDGRIGIGTYFIGGVSSMVPNLKIIYESEVGLSFSGSGADCWNTFFVSKNPFNHVGNLLTSSTWDSYKNNFQAIDWSTIDPTYNT